MGGIGVATAVGGAGLLAFSGGVAAAQVSITAANTALVSNDRGDISQVTADPEFHVHWQNLDDAVGKVFFLVEANVGGTGWQPIFRATPWIGQEVNNAYIRQVPGTTGMYRVKVPLSQALNQDPRFSDGDGPDASASPLVIADEQGKPDYSTLSFPGGVDESSFLDGTSIGSASAYPGAHQEGGHQNNYHDIDAGYYGAAADTSALDNPNDGSDQTTVVQLRYTFELQRPNLGQLKYLVDFTGLSTDEEKKQKAADELDWLEVSDIDAGNSKIVMNGEDGNTNFGNPSGIPYNSLIANADDHVGVLSTVASFNVKVRNEGSDSGVTGSSNTNAS
ncbi:MULTISPECIES: hypothetical protein [Haloferax]|uniref:Uncharacterized protein n=1 Tax=Haloferax marinum TaxID=2666143 RepID=A0A6A8G8C4_9EURY|nr:MULTISPECIES: hypothetical protein [Haloferax]KAB1198178.1 hypothetical protein Hfx1150_11895 [Haloferax sp. CBA1150]MRW97261.1 hypothetical protein [Haloferax marinum]